MNYTELLKDPRFRVARRVIATVLGVMLAGFALKVGVDPSKAVDNLLLIQAVDIVQLLKLGIGAAILMGLDKLKRELPNLQS